MKIILALCWLLLLDLSTATQTGCLAYTENNQCAHCVQGYYLTTSFTCLQCAQNCLECISNTICTICGYGYFLNEGICLPGQKHCVSTNSFGLCNSCLLGYELNNAKCFLCPNYCLQCNNSVCTTCAYGFGLNSTANNVVTCQICGGNCANCSWINTQVFCTNCSQTFYLSVRQNQCLPCPNECLSCKSSGCILCEEGYYLNSQDCTACEVGCLSCSASQFCISCQAGYFLNITNTIQECLPCSQECIECEVAQFCMNCAATFYINNGSCLSCGPLCNTCSSSSNCMNCFDSYYSNNGICVNCPVPCFTCQSQNICLSCTSNQLIVINDNCISCGTIMTGCLNCSASNNCLVCAEDYDLISGICLQQSNELSTTAIVVISVLSFLVAVGIGVGIYFFWKKRRGFMGSEQTAQGSSQLRATYYQIP